MSLRPVSDVGRSLESGLSRRDAKRSGHLLSSLSVTDNTKAFLSDEKSFVYPLGIELQQKIS